MSTQTIVMSNQTKAVRKGRDWREWALLTVAGTLAAMALLPGAWSQVVQVARAQGISIPAFLALQFGESALQIAIIAAVGLFFAHRSGLGAPILEGWLAGETVGGRLKSILAPSIILGLASGVIAIVIDRMIFRPLLPGFSTIISQIGGWQGLVASFDGGILEELEMRLLILSVVAWLIARINHTTEGKPSRAALWTATTVAALVFAGGHLPATSASVAITPPVIVRSLALNGGLGLLYGYLYCKRGLEAAMLTHFSSDLVVHFIQSLF